MAKNAANGRLQEQTERAPAPKLTLSGKANGADLRKILGRTAKAIESIDRASVMNLGLCPTDVEIMEALHEVGDMTVGQIGERVLLTSGSMTAAINRLNKKGFVERAADKVDGRIFWVKLKPKGKNFMKSMLPEHQQRLDVVMENLSQKDKATLISLLEKVSENALENRAATAASAQQ